MSPSLPWSTPLPEAQLLRTLLSRRWVNKGMKSSRLSPCRSTPIATTAEVAFRVALSGGDENMSLEVML
jgi:hypothetical protein